MIKRLVDILASFFGLIFFSPILLPAMFLIWKEDKSSPFYVRPRLGKNGIPFKMIKLRSMEVDADKSLELVTLIDKHVEKALTEEKKKGKKRELKKAPLPYKKEDSKYIFKFKMKAKGTNSRTGEAFTQRPAIFDNELKPLSKDLIVWGGSTLRVSFFPREWYTPLLGAGCSLRMKSVQVKNLVEGSSMNGSSQGFEKVEGDSSTKNESDEEEISKENNSSADF